MTVSGINVSYGLEYLANSSGELSKVTVPNGAALRWAYADFTYVGSRTLREVLTRYLAKTSGAAETAYPLAHDPGDSSRTAHALTTLADPGGVGQKAWSFTTTGTWQMGLVSSLEERAAAGGTLLRKQDYTWTQDAAGSPYISSVLTTPEPGGAFQKQSKTEQTLDTKGNVTQSKLYD